MAKLSVFCQLTACCFLITSGAWGDEKKAPLSGSLAELQHQMRMADTGGGKFQLELPLIGKPLLINWQVGNAPTYDFLRWPTYNWEALLAGSGPLNLIAFNRVQPAPELNCLGTTCAPTQEKTLGADLRLNLGGTGVIPDNFLFLRRESVRGAPRSFSRLKIGIGGVLDL
jgi:hypothetical protein